jgi:hypothetical protein
MGTHHEILGKNGKVRIGNLVPTSIMYVYIYIYIYIERERERDTYIHTYISLVATMEL